MFDNTITLNIDGADRTCTRINQDKYSSEYRYRSSTLVVDLKLRNTQTGGTNSLKRDRHNVEIVTTTFNVDGSPRTRKAYVVFEHDQDHSVDAVESPVLALASLLTETNIGKLYLGES